LIGEIEGEKFADFMDLPEDFKKSLGPMYPFMPPLPGMPGLPGMGGIPGMPGMSMSGLPGLGIPGMMAGYPHPFGRPPV
jgi:signal recognition particle subunit SRP54